jgi:hypothetical protein
MLARQVDVAQLRLKSQSFDKFVREVVAATAA